MSFSGVIEFPAVAATAELKAAWIAAAEADGDWWDAGLDEPRLEMLEEPAPGQVWAALAANRVVLPAPAPAGTPSGVKVEATVDPVWVDADPGPVPAGLAGWSRREWWFAPVREGVRALMTMAPGPELVAALTQLEVQSPCPADHSHRDPGVEAADPTPAPGGTPGHPCSCQLIITAAWQAIESWAQVRGCAALVDAAGPEPVTVTPTGFARAQVTDPATRQLAPMLHLAPTAVPGRLRTARDLHTFPALAALAGDGTLFVGAWRAVLTETVNLPQAARARVIDHMVAVFAGRRAHDRRPWTPTETHKAVREAMHTLAREELDQARSEAMKGRRVHLSPDSDGMAWLNALLSEVDAHRIYNRLTAAAAAAKADDPDDDRTADQRRADLLTALLLGHTGSADSGDCGGDGPGETHQPDCPGIDGNASPVGPVGPPGSDAEGDEQPRAAQGTGPIPITARPDVSVVVTLATLLGLAADPAHVPGLGPIPADIARDLAADGAWRLWITDPSTGHVTATGSRTYTPTAALARIIRAREPNCRMPGCARQAVNCDLDHTIPYPGEPGTVESNLGPLCRGHHNLKTHHGYHLENLPNPNPDSGHPDPDSGPPGWRWTFPSGLTHTDHPDPPLGGP